MGYKYLSAITLIVVIGGCKPTEEWVRFDRNVGSTDAFSDTLVATISNAPADDSTDTSMAAIIGGNDVDTYSYKIGLETSLDCTDPSGYSAPQTRAQVINDPIDDKIGPLAICVLGIDASGHRQKPANATRYAWTRTWLPKIFIESPGRMAVTTVNVTLQLHGPAAFNEVYLTNNSNCTSGGAWQARTDTKPWTLDVASTGATATVYGRFRTATGKISPCVSRSVSLSAVDVAKSVCTGPFSSTSLTGVLTDSGGAAGNYANNEDCSMVVTSSVPLTFTFSQFNTESGYDFLTMYNGSALPANIILNTSGTSIPAPVTNTGTTTIRFKSDGGVVAAGFQLTWDAVAESLLGSIKINNDNPSTTTPNVNLTILSSIGLKEMYITNTAGCAAGGTWESYRYSKAWTLPTGDGNKTVYIKFRDWEGHETGCESDSILMYETVPLAVLSGTPANMDGSDNLNVTVSGAGVTKYRYKVGPAATTDCSVAVGYSTPAVPIATLLTSSIVSLPSGSMRLCVLGSNPIGIEQSLATATSYTWTRDVPAIVELLESGRVVNEANQNLTFTFTIPAPASLPITIDYDFFGELVPVLGLTSSQVVLPAGQTSVNVTVPIVASPVSETDKRVTISIAKVSSPNKIGFLGQSSVTVVDAQRTPASVVDIGHYGKCGILSNGALMCTGDIGGPTTGTHRFSSGFTRLAAGVNFKKIIMDRSFAHFCALATTDELYCWGWGFDGQLGNGGNADQPTPVLVPGLTWKSVSSTASWNNLCGIDSNDDLYCWGDGTFSKGANGSGGTTDQRSPIKIDSAVKYKSVIVRSNHACAISLGGVLKCWGDNTGGVLGDGTTVDKLAPVLIDSGVTYSSILTDTAATCGITTTGALKCWGNGVLTPTTVDATRVYTTVVFNGSLTCGLAASKLYCMGTDSRNDLGLGSPIASMTAIDAGTSYVELAAGYTPDFICGRRTDGYVNCFGAVQDNTSNSAFASTYPKTPTKWDSDTFTMIKGVAEGICGITTSGFAKCLSRRTMGRYSASDAPIASALNTTAQMGSSVVFKTLDDRCGIDTGNNLRCWGGRQSKTNQDMNKERTSPVIEFSPMQFKAISNGPTTKCGIQTDNTLWCWGATTGDGTTTTRNTPVAVDAPTTYKAVSAAKSNACAITMTNDLKCWGTNANGTTGLGDTAQHLTPTFVAANYSRVVVSENMACGITTLGVLNCWGKNTNGIGNNSTQALSPTVIAAGTNFTEVAISFGMTACAIRASDSQVMCWGHGYAVGDGGSTTRATPVLVAGGAAFSKLFGRAVAGAEYSAGAFCGLTNNGASDPDLKCWGDYRWPMPLSPTAVYTGPFKTAGWANQETILIIDGSDRLLYSGTAFGVPGSVQRLKTFEVIQGLNDH